jgi:outer membrane protein TolC
LTSSILIEADAMERRVDLRLARTNLEIFAKTLSLTHATRYINALAMQAAHLLAEKAVNVRSEVREAFIAYKGAFEVARLYQAQV